MLRVAAMEENGLRERRHREQKGDANDVAEPTEERQKNEKTIGRTPDGISK